METKLKEYTGGDPDSKEAYFSRDVSGPEDEDVVVDNFIWHRKKSNDNLSDEGQGKGFSFYYARNAFKDQFHCYVPNKRNPNNFRLLGIVYRNVMVVIHCEYEDDNTIRIISAWETSEDSKDSNTYWENKYRMEYRLENQREGPKRESTEQNSRFTRDVDKDIVYAHVSKKIHERKLEDAYVTKKMQERIFEKVYDEAFLITSSPTPQFP